MLAYVLMSFVEVHRYVFLRDILSLDEVTEPTFRHRVPVCIISVSSVSVVLFLIPVSFSSGHFLCHCTEVSLVVVHL